MNVLVILVPVSITLGLLALIGFVWTLRADQYEDLDGDAARALFNEDDPT